MMESIRPLKENPELAKELADILLPYIMESVEYKFIVETREKLNALVEAVSRLQEAVNRNSEDIRAMQQDIKLLHEDNKKLWEAVNKNSEDIKIMQQEIKQLHEENNRLWEAVNRNSEDIKIMQQEIRQLQEQSGQIQQEIRVLQEENKKLWEAVNKNSEDIKLLHEDNKKLWEAVNKNSEDIKLLHEDNKKLWEAIDSLTRSVQRLEVVVGSFTGRAGVYMERTMLELYKEALRLHGIDVSKVRSAKIVDQAGVYQKGKEFQVDIIEEDGVTYLFEIKNYGDEDVLEQVETRRRILEAMGRNVKVFIVANIIEDKVKAEAEKEGIAVVAGHVVESPR
jgi:chromosome segregation ATPase